MVARARSFLFVRGDDDRRLRSAWTAPADAVIADLEDGVAPARKQQARELLAAHIARGRPGGALLVRVNAMGTAEFGADLDLLLSLSGVDAIVIPKARADAIRVTEFTRPVVALVETAEGLLEAPQIAALAGVSRLMLGTVDLAAQLGIDIDPHSPLFQHARAGLVLASASAGKPPPIDGVWPRLEDEDGLRREACIARATGFGAKACIHPTQLEVAHQVFSPSAEQLAWAHSVVAAGDRSFEAGEGAVNVDGEMVDLPVLTRARRLLARSEDLDN
jgi:citrate lyase beta subunit